MRHTKTTRPKSPVIQALTASAPWVLISKPSQVTGLTVYFAMPRYRLENLKTQTTFLPDRSTLGFCLEGAIPAMNLDQAGSRNPISSRKSMLDML